MSNEKMIVATVSVCVQIGQDDFKQERTSRCFAISRSIKDVLTWAEASGIKNPTMADIVFSEYTGQSF